MKVVPRFPSIAVQNRQRTVRIDPGDLEIFGRRIIEACLRIPEKQTSRLAKLGEVNVIVISDRRMATLHRRFLGIAGATDVITFQHGEIFVSAETARRQARQLGTSIRHELQLYITHGLLHLHGFDDKDAAGAAEMARLQERLLGGAEMG